VKFFRPSFGSKILETFLSPGLSYDITSSFGESSFTAQPKAPALPAAWQAGAFGWAVNDFLDPYSHATGTARPSH